MEYYELVNGNVGNEIELVMKILTIKSRILQVSQKQKEYGIDLCGNDKVPSWEYIGIITDVQIRLMIIYQRRVSVMSGVFPNRSVTQLRVR
jgi:hypothetical protein